MAIFNLQDRTINAKIVYYGPALGGKTTSLKWVHHILDPNNEIELVSLNTEQDRTLFFDFLPISLGTIEGFRIKLQAFTVPGQVMYNQTRKYVLTGADAVVMVIDSQADQFVANQESLLNLDENLKANGLNPDEIPLVLQYNKRDIAAARAVEELEGELNTRGLASFATVAITGEGVFEAFTEIAVQTLDGFVGRELGDSRGSSLASSLRDKLLGQQMAVHPQAAPARPVRAGTRRLAKARPFAAAQELVTPPAGPAGEEDELLRQAVNSNMEVANLLAEVHEARQELRRKVDELTTLYETGQSLASSVREDRVLDQLLEAATAGAGTEHGSILVPRTDDRGYLAPECRGFLQDPLTQVLDTSAARAGLLPDPGGEPILVDRAGRPDLIRELARHENGLRELVLVPLDLESDRRTVLAVYRVGTAAPALAERIPFLRAVVAQARIAAENARLLAQIEGFNRELEKTVEERTEDLRVALTELRTLDSLKDDFLSSISHELLTPLTSICSFSEILLDFDESHSIEERREFLTIIRAEADRLTGKVRDVLDLTHLEAGKVTFKPEDIEVRPLLNEVFDVLREKILARKVKVRITQGRTPPRAVVDPKWLSRVLRLLLLNAIQWSPSGGSVGIRIRREGEGLGITVSDEGPGIPASDHERVFDRFKQLGDTNTEKPAGIGLGLPLARAIVTRMGSTISLESDPGQGTRVTVTVPTTAKAAGVEEGIPRDALTS